MSTDNNPRALLDELETLQRVLDDSAGEQIDFDRVLKQLNTVDDVPVLSDLFNKNDSPMLQPVKKPAARSHLSAVKPSAPEPAQERPVITRDVLEYLREEMLRKGKADNGAATLSELLGRYDEQRRPKSDSQSAQAEATAIADDDVPTLTDEEPGQNLMVNLSHQYGDETSDESDGQFMLETLMDQIASNNAADDEAAALVEQLMMGKEADSSAGNTPATDSSIDVAPKRASTTRNPGATSAPARDSGSAAADQTANPSAHRSSGPGTSPSTDQGNVQSADSNTASKPGITDVAPAVSDSGTRSTITSGNPFLPQSVLDRLTSERTAALKSAEEAHQTMQRVMEAKMQRDRESLAHVTQAEKEQIVDALIEELTPVIQAKLREKLRAIVGRKPSE